MFCFLFFFFFFFQAEDGIRDLVRSRGLGDVYKRQGLIRWRVHNGHAHFDKLLVADVHLGGRDEKSNLHTGQPRTCLLYTSDAADDLLCVDLGGRRIIKKKKNKNNKQHKE